MIIFHEVAVINIDGTEKQSEKNFWNLSGTTAAYGTANKTLATVKGIKSTDGLFVVTIKTSNIRTAKKVSVSGNARRLIQFCRQKMH